MRVILTEIYFDRSNVELAFEAPAYHRRNKNPGVAIAWLPTRTDAKLSVRDFSENLLRRPLRVSNNSQDVRIFLDLCAQGAERRFRGVRRSWYVHNSEIVQSLLTADIILEQSPPISLPLSTLMSKAPAIAIGTYVGIEAAAGHPMLMLATVPGGIIAVASAIGISKALEKGLNKSVERLFR